MLSDAIQEYKIQIYYHIKEIEKITEKAVEELLTELIKRYKDDTKFLIEELEKLKKIQSQCEKDHNITCPLLKQDWEEENK